MKRLSGADAAFLYMETPSSHMHVAAIGVYDRSTATEPLTVTSYLSRMMFGFHGCREVVDDPWFLATAADESAAELGAAVQAGAGAGAGAGAARVQRVARQEATASAPSP